LLRKFHIRGATNNIAVVKNLPAYPIFLNDLNLPRIAGQVKGTDFCEGSKLSLNTGKQAVTPFQNTTPNSSAKLGGTWRKLGGRRVFVLSLFVFCGASSFS
jgi:hypothetical protein